MEVEKTEPGNNFNVLVLLGCFLLYCCLFAVHLSSNDFYFKLVSVGPFQEDESCWEELTQNSCKLYYECCLSTTSSWSMTCEQSTVPESCFFTLASHYWEDSSNSECKGTLPLPRGIRGELSVLLYLLIFSKKRKAKKSQCSHRCQGIVNSLDLHSSPFVWMFLWSWGLQKMLPRFPAQYTCDSETAFHQH